jgi:hypothetical protein
MSLMLLHVDIKATDENALKKIRDTLRRSVLHQLDHPWPGVVTYCFATVPGDDPLSMTFTELYTDAHTFMQHAVALGTTFLSAFLPCNHTSQTYAFGDHSSNPQVRFTVDGYLKAKYPGYQGRIKSNAKIQLSKAVHLVCDYNATTHGAAGAPQINPCEDAVFDVSFRRENGSMRRIIVCSKENAEAVKVEMEDWSVAQYSSTDLGNSCAYLGYFIHPQSQHVCEDVEDKEVVRCVQEIRERNAYQEPQVQGSEILDRLAVVWHMSKILFGYTCKRRKLRCD